MFGKIILTYFIIGFLVGLIYINTTFKTLAVYKNDKFKELMKYKRTKYTILFIFIMIYAVMWPLTIKDMITFSLKNRKSKGVSK